jgi:hypothetical protein
MIRTGDVTCLQKSMRITTRRGVGRLTSAKPAYAKTPWVPTWSSSVITSFVGGHDRDCRWQSRHAPIVPWPREPDAVA